VRERLLALRDRLLRRAGRWDRLLELDPADEEAHLALMRSHVAAGDRAAALQQFELLDRALRRDLDGRPSAAATRLRDEVRDGVMAAMRELGPVTTAERTRLEQRIQFCRTADGVGIAYASTGSGPPLVKAAHWLTHLDHDWHSPVRRHFLVDLSRRHRLIRYDERGTGLSDWDLPDELVTFESWVADLAAVVDAAGLDRTDLLGISQGGAVALVYAARHPERVRRLVIYGSYAQGRLVRARSDEEVMLNQLQIDLARVGWGRDDPAFRQVFTAQFMPEGSRELWDAFNDLQRATASPANAARVLTISGTIDVVDEARRVQAPTLVLHARDDHRPPFEQGRLIASLVPDSRFVALESRNHILLADEPAWPVFLREVEAFLAEPD
jgi:pimeloyl-ACP methyl ester carboxylesterase